MGASTTSVSRRELLAASSGILFAGALAGTSGQAHAAPGAILVVDPALPEVKALPPARRSVGARIVMLQGDPMRIWRRDIAGRGRSVEGVTLWSDFVVLRELAHDGALRVRREEHLPNPGGPLLVHWVFA